MPVTQKQIAEKLGVSQQLVGFALRGSDSQVSAKMRRKIVAAARELGYAPNTAARMLRSGKTNTVMLAYLKAHSSEFQLYNATLIQILAEELGEVGYKIEVRCASDREPVLRGLREAVAARSCDAVVLWGTQSEVEEQGDLLESLGQPFVANGDHELTRPHWLQADFDHAGMMRQTIDKLAEMGHTRIAYLGHDNNQLYARRYLAGFHASIADRFNRETPPNWLLLSRETVESGRQILARIQTWMSLPQKQRPTAIACGEGGSTVATIELALISNGISVGNGANQFAIAGYLGAPQVRLISGPSWAYRTDVDVDMIKAMIHQQLMPLALSGEPQVRAMRYLPRLTECYPAIEISAHRLTNLTNDAYGPETG